MVLEEVEKLNIEEDKKEILKWVALFHDIGKPYTTTKEDGRIRHHGHSKRSYHIAMELLENTHINNYTKIEILNLIKLHGKPNWAFEKEDPERYVIDLSMSCNLELLYEFAKCDFLGRISDDTKENLENIEYFKVIAQDLNCFKKSI